MTLQKEIEFVLKNLRENLNGESDRLKQETGREIIDSLLIYSNDLFKSHVDVRDTVEIIMHRFNKIIESLK